MVVLSEKNFLEIVEELTLEEFRVEIERICFSSTRTVRTQQSTLFYNHTIELKLNKPVGIELAVVEQVGEQAQTRTMILTSA